VSGWRPALRIARRQVWRNLSRSLLVAVLVGIPVAGATFVDILVRTLSSPEHETTQAIGSADASLLVTPYERLQDYRPSRWGQFEQPLLDEPVEERDVESVDVAALLPAGARAVPEPAYLPVRLDTGKRVVRTTMVGADAGDPLHAHIATLDSGRLPTAGDEVLVTRPLAERVHLLDDDGRLVDDAAITVQNGPSARVTGVATSPYCLDCEQVVVVRSISRFVVNERLSPSELPSGAYLVDLPAGTDLEPLWTQLAEQGVALTPRDVYLHPDDYTDEAGAPLLTAESLRAVALAALIVGLGLLEVVLLAGTAFAVGARRQVRELGVIAASGATARQVRRVVLAQGLVLGLIGSALGIAFGALVAVAGKSWWERLVNAVITDWRFGPAEIAMAAAVGAVSGLLAAVVPAFGASRLPPVDALSGRFRVSRVRRRRTPMVGAALMSIGAVMCLLGDRRLATDFAEYSRRLETVAQTGSWVQPPSPTGPLALLLGGATLLVIGMVVVAPSVIGWLSSAGRLLPLSGRLAVRDAARHRHRTGPATSAIAMAVAGSVVFAFVVAGYSRGQQLQHVPSIPEHTIQVSAYDLPEHEAALAESADAAAALLPDADVMDIAMPMRPAAPNEAPYAIDGVVELYVTEHMSEDCASGCMYGGPPAVADERLIRLVVGHDLDDAARSALAAGKVLVTSPTQLDARGNVRIESGFDEQTGPLSVTLPGHLVERQLTFASLPGAFIPADVVQAQGWTVSTRQMLVAYDESATADDVDLARSAAERNGVDTHVETGPSKEDGEILLLLAAVAAAFVTLAGVAISVALSAAEGRADLATLAAVGAAPRRRRSLAAAQALLVSGVGCALGLGLGTFISYSLRATFGAPEFVVPWMNVFTVGLVVPAFAVLVAALFTPSRLPLIRRAG
jgi:putative ABC transport system permease protein